MTIVGNDGLQAMRHVATDACDKVKVSCGPFLCDEALQFVHGFRVPSIHSLLQIVPQFLDRIEIRTPCRPVDEVNAVIVEPFSTGCSFVMRCPVETTIVLEARIDGPNAPDSAAKWIGSDVHRRNHLTCSA